MAKLVGTPATVTIDDGAGTVRVITNDVLSVTLETTRDLADVTGVDKTGKQRLGMLNDATVTLTGAWNPAAAPTFYTTFKDIATTNIDRTVVLAYPGPATFTAEMALESVSYALQNGQLTCSVTLQLSGGTQGVWS
jgi:hypothetical protein